LRPQEQCTHRRQDRHRDHVDRDHRWRAVLGQQRGGNQGREPAAENGADLLHQRQAAVANAGREEFSEERTLRAVDRTMAKREAERNGEIDRRG
jgi:hypothetical protein